MCNPIFELYLSKIDAILDNSDLISDCISSVSDKIKNWLLCEWQCGSIEDMHLYGDLVSVVDSLIDSKLKAL